MFHAQLLVLHLRILHLRMTGHFLLENGQEQLKTNSTDATKAAPPTVTSSGFALHNTVYTHLQRPQPRPKTYVNSNTSRCYVLACCLTTYSYSPFCCHPPSGQLPSGCPGLPGWSSPCHWMGNHRLHQTSFPRPLHQLSPGDVFSQLSQATFSPYQPARKYWWKLNLSKTRELMSLNTTGKEKKQLRQPTN